MKKILFFILILFVITLGGCYKHYEDATFVDVKFYDLDDNEIEGEFRNDLSFNNSTLKLSSNQFIQLNSAAPVINYYCAEVEEGVTIKVVMKFKLKINYEMVSLKIKCLNDNTFIGVEKDDIEVIDNFTYIIYFVENVSSDYNFFQVSSWVDVNEGEHLFSIRGSNTYIRGFYFIFESETDDTNF